MNPNKKLLLALLCACSMVLCVVANAQVKAGINANGREMIHGDTINVCRGSTITYTSTAQGSAVLSWRFNNGSPASMNGAGPFNITYNVNGYDTTFQKVGSGAFADSMFIIVRVADEKPVAGFNFSPDDVCGNETISFTNTTVNGAPFWYVWDFGDGKTSVDESPSHQYLDAVGAGSQTFTVKLIATNANTCVDSVTHTVAIRSVPDAGIGNADPAVTVGTYMDTVSFRTCNYEPSYNFSFVNNSSTVPVNSLYTITWGDGSPDTSFATWPATDTIRHLFPSGKSTMTLKVTGTSGCVGIRHYIVYVGGFPYGDLTNNGSSDICEQDSLNFSLTNTAGNTPGTSYIFYINDFSEGQFFQHPPPATIGQRFTKNSCSYLSDDGTQVYNNALGAYLLVQNPCGVNSAFVVPIHVSSKPAPSIYVTDTVACTGATVGIINTSGFGNIVLPGVGTDANCVSRGKTVWTISPATGYTLTTGTLGSFNGNRNNQAVWTSGNDSLDVLFTSPGLYRVTIYVGNEKCGIDSTTTTICVRTPPQASFTMSQESSCGPAIIDLVNTSSISECTSGASGYTWRIEYSDPETCAPAGSPGFEFVNGSSDTTASPSISVTAAGQYIISLTARASGSGTSCAESIFTDTFYVKGPMQMTIPTLPAVCVNNTVNPSVSITRCYSTGGLGYQWSFTNGNPSVSTDSLPGPVLFSVSGDQNIQLIITDSSCMQMDTVSAIVSVNPLPGVSVIGDTTVCSGSSINLGGAGIPGINYTWSPATELDDPHSANPALTVYYDGSASDTLITYQLNYIQDEHCIAQDSVSVRISKLPLLTVTPANSQICRGDSIQLIASGADQFSWTPDIGLNSNNGNIVIAYPDTTTTYRVEGINQFGCAAEEMVTLTVMRTPVSSFSPTEISVCSNDTIISFAAQTQADGDGSIHYKWFVNDDLQSGANPFSFRFQRNGINPEEYAIRLEAEDDNGCGVSNITGRVVLHPPPSPNIEVSPAVVQQQPNYEFGFRDLSPSDPNLIHTWTMGDRRMQTMNGQSITYQYGDTGTYNVQLTVKDFLTGCSASDTVSVTILHVPGYIQVPNAICPGCSNHSLRQFLPLAKGLKKYRLSIYTTWGQKVFETTSLDASGSPNVPWDGTANGKALQQDVFTWQIEGLFTNGTEWKGMIYPGKNTPVKAGFITVIK